MKTREIARRRMHNLGLWGAPLDGVESVVGWLGALQSQEFALARWSVGQRAEGVDAAAVDRAFAGGGVLRTHLLRPTWHFVLPSDIRWMLALTAPRVHAMNAHYYRTLGLDDALLARTDAVLATGLESGEHRTRSELAVVLAGAGVTASGPRLAYIMMHAELDAVICSGAPRGRQQTYAAFDQRVPPAAPLDRDEALAVLIRRYFAARGPATVKDCAWWSSLRAADVRRGLEMVSAEFEHEAVDGREYWFPAAGHLPRGGSGVVDLVQGYDEVIVSYSLSKDLLRAGVDAGGQERTVFTHAILLDGRLVGHWKPVPGKDEVAIETFLYRPPGARRAASPGGGRGTLRPLPGPACRARVNEAMRQGATVAGTRPAE